MTAFTVVPSRSGAGKRLPGGAAALALHTARGGCVTLPLAGPLALHFSCCASAAACPHPRPLCVACPAAVRTFDQRTVLVGGCWAVVVRASGCPFLRARVCATPVTASCAHIPPLAAPPHNTRTCLLAASQVGLWVGEHQRGRRGRGVSSRMSPAGQDGSAWRHQIHGPMPAGRSEGSERSSHAPQPSTRRSPPHPHAAAVSCSGYVFFGSSVTVVDTVLGIAGATLESQPHLETSPSGQQQPAQLASLPSSGTLRRTYDNVDAVLGSSRQPGYAAGSALDAQQREGALAAALAESPRFLILDFRQAGGGG